MAEKNLLTKRNPFNFPDLLGEEWGVIPGIMSSGLSVYKTNKNVIVEASLPGLKRDDIEVMLERNFLSIQGKKQEEEQNQDKQYYRKATSSFSYNIELPDQTDFSKEPKASFQDGILTLSFNKNPTSEPKKIAIK